MSNPHETWYVCDEPFVSADPDFPFNGRKGVTRLRGDDPAFKRFAKFFKPMTSSDRTAPPVEEALAVPGRKRGG
ncbi:MAG TPA: hypothetical protein VNN79_18315 [Actinomycetota bacterium]|nr:hypothetical protein [Actinomycetota bacterium]